MFPIPWNRAFRKKDGTLVNMEDMGGGGSSDIPEYSEADAGKVLAVNDSGELEWATVSSSDSHYNRIVSPLATIGINEGEVKEVQ